MSPWKLPCTSMDVDRSQNLLRIDFPRVRVFVRNDCSCYSTHLRLWGSSHARRLNPTPNPDPNPDQSPATNERETRLRRPRFFQIAPICGPRSPNCKHSRPHIARILDGSVSLSPRVLWWSACRKKCHNIENWPSRVSRP